MNTETGRKCGCVRNGLIPNKLTSYVFTSINKMGLYEEIAAIGGETVTSASIVEMAVRSTANHTKVMHHRNRLEKHKGLKIHTSQA